MSDLSCAKKVKTRKIHLCELCCRSFPIGTEMIVYSGIYDGDWYKYHCCETCAKLIPLLDFRDDGVGQGEMMDFVAGNDLKTPEELLEKLQNEKLRK
jgi:hypothetical protein